MDTKRRIALCVGVLVVYIDEAARAKALRHDLGKSSSAGAQEDAHS